MRRVKCVEQMWCMYGEEIGVWCRPQARIDRVFDMHSSQVAAEVDSGDDDENGDEW